MSKQSVFHLDHQHQDLSSKITVGLERISEAFRVLLWEHAKVIGLSPIQIQILIFIAHHQEQLCNVSHLAKEFNLTKPTISDAIKVLVKKELVKKLYSEEDRRAYFISLTDKGNKMVEETEHFAHPLQAMLSKLEDKELEQLFNSLSKLIFGLNRKGILNVQRTCYGCQFYSNQQNQHYCQLLEKTLLDRDIRIDCPEFILKHD